MTLCWFVMLGNCLTPVFSPAILIGLENVVRLDSQPMMQQILGLIIVYILPVTLLAITAFRCAFVLRANIIRSIQAEKANSQDSE